MKLKQLVKGIPSLEIKGSKDVEILGLCNNSQFAAPGYLFFAKKGSKLSGNQFIRDAALAGSVAIATDLFDPFLKQVVQIVHPDVTALESLLTERFYDYPSHQLLSIGITGTNGKTTCSYLIKHFLDRVGIATGLIGTIEWIIKDKILPSNLTTPDAITSQKLLHEMKITGCQGVVMEVSSHALVQKELLVSILISLFLRTLHKIISIIMRQWKSMQKLRLFSFLLWEVMEMWGSPIRNLRLSIVTVLGLQR